MARQGALYSAGPLAAGRPAGTLLWVHGADATEEAALLAMAGRMRSEGDQLSLLLTGGASNTAAPGAVRAPVPLESPLVAAQFLTHWRPDLLLWMGGDLRPTLLAEADRAGLPRLLVDAEAARLGPRHGWLGGSRHALLRGFRHALAIDTEAGLRLRRAGLDDRRIEVTGRLRETSQPLPCNEAERAALSVELASRPIWFAARARQDEIPLILTAHGRASRRSHRLLLVLMPTQDVDSAALAERLFERGYSVALRSEGHEVTEATEIVLADAPGELGLWHLLSPISFIGGTLRGGGGSDPFEAATLGSAILHGPLIEGWNDNYQRLARAGASRSSRTAEELGIAVEALLAPDRAAAMTHAGWETVSAGAEVTNRLIDLIRAGLEGGD